MDRSGERRRARRRFRPRGCVRVAVPARRVRPAAARGAAAGAPVLASDIPINREILGDSARVLRADTTARAGIPSSRRSGLGPICEPHCPRRVSPTRRGSRGMPRPQPGTGSSTARRADSPPDRSDRQNRLVNIGFVVTTLGRLDPLRASDIARGAAARRRPRRPRRTGGTRRGRRPGRGVRRARRRRVGDDLGTRCLLGRNTGVAALPAGEAVGPSRTTTRPIRPAPCPRCTTPSTTRPSAPGGSPRGRGGPKTTLPEPGTPLDK